MAIQLVYELSVPPGRLREVADLFDERYLPDAAERGMVFESRAITPPIELDDAPTTLVLRWSLADADAVWAMKRRAQSDDIAEFWRTIDAIVPSRQRRFLADY